MSSEFAQQVYEYARRGQVAHVVEALAFATPDEYVGYDGSTALHMACKKGYYQICEVLISKGADMSLRVDDGSTVLLLAAATGNVSLMSLFLTHRLVDINERNEDGFTPLDIALHYKHYDLASLLKSCGAVCGTSSCIDGEFISGPSEKWGYGVFDEI